MKNNRVKYRFKLQQSKKKNTWFHKVQTLYNQFVLFSNCHIISIWFNEYFLLGKKGTDENLEEKYKMRK